MPSPRSEGGANGDLGRAGRGTGQQQVRDVRAGDEQNKSDRAQERQVDQLRVAVGEIVVIALDLDSDVLVRGWILPFEAAGQCRELGPGGARLSGRSQTTEHGQAPVVAFLPLGVRNEREQELARAGKLDAGRQDADHKLVLH